MNDESLGALASSVLPLMGKTSGLEACAPSIFAGGKDNATFKSN
jgi:hypothetical protein